MKLSQWKMLAVVATSAVVAGCGSGMGGGRMWVPQGPGDIPEARAQPAPRAAPAVAAAAPAAQPPSAPVSTAAPGGYTQATRYGDLLFISGQIGLDAAGQLRGTAEEQTRQAMENVRAILESHRLTLANIVSVTVYMKDLNGDFRAMDAAYESFFRTALPSRSLVEVSRLPRNALVEITVVAGR
jgi:2-iminobutanoate/2-iminopropanoate deaminase